MPRKPVANSQGFGRRSIYRLHTRIVLITLLPLLCSDCAVVTVADAAVSVVATTVKVGATVVETAVDVTAAGVKAVVGSDDEDEKE
jgi:hypothetical protein